MPRCQLVVSHGGAGTMLGAAAHGVPQVVLPQAADHFRNAHALVSANAGRAIAIEKQKTDELMADLESAMRSDTLRAGAGALRREMAAMATVDAAVSALEQSL